jgi:hypothetical protein
VYWVHEHCSDVYIVSYTMRDDGVLVSGPTGNRSEGDFVEVKPAKSAVEIPKQYRGDWCQTKWQTIYQRGFKNCSGAELEIRRTYFNTVEHAIDHPQKQIRRAQTVSRM